LCGGLIPVTGPPVLDQLSRAVPARWGFAATASTTDLRAISPFTPQEETLWSHDPGRWLLNMTLLIALASMFHVVAVGGVCWGGLS
jgi:ABC transport system ATP-binding/permease protein